LQNALKFAISNEVEMYDTASDSWSITTLLPDDRHHAGIASLNGLLYVVGGFTKSFMSVWHAVSTVYQYNPATKEWHELAPIEYLVILRSINAPARHGLGSAVVNGLYVISGDPTPGGSFSQINEILIPSTVE